MFPREFKFYRSKLLHVMKVIEFQGRKRNHTRPVPRIIPRPGAPDRKLANISFPAFLISSSSQLARSTSQVELSALEIEDAHGHAMAGLQRATSKPTDLRFTSSDEVRLFLTSPRQLSA